MGAVQFRLRGSGWRGAWRHMAMPMLLAVTACVRPATDARADGSWSYVVDAPADGSRTVVVEATFDNARTDTIAIARESSTFVRDVQLKTGSSWRTVERRGTQWVEPACMRHCTVRYRIDLGELAAACGDEVDCARRIGDSTLSPALAWLAHPSPKTDVPVSVRVRVPAGAQFASGMHATDESGTAFGFRSYDLDEGSFSAFGPMRHYRVDVSGKPGREGGRARVDIEVVGKQKYGMSDEEIREWVDEASQVVTPLFGRSHHAVRRPREGGGRGRVRQGPVARGRIGGARRGRQDAGGSAPSRLGARPRALPPGLPDVPRRGSLAW
jgi:hypothetical protein